MRGSDALPLLLLTDAEAPSGEDVAVLEAAGGRVEVTTLSRDGTLPAVPDDVVCVVCPHELDEVNGVDVLRAVRESGNDVPFVLYASDGDEHVASAAIGAGVTDYVPVEDGVTPAVAERAMTAANRYVADEASASAKRAAFADREHDVEERERALQRAYEVMADAERPFDQQVTDLLEVVRESLGTEYATLSHVDGDDYTFEAVGAPEDDELRAGDRTSLQATNCERVVSTQETLVLNDIEREAPELADRSGNTEWGISCYLGAPVTVDGEPYGTFCFYDREPRAEAFSEWQVTFVDLFSDWVSYELERQQYIDRLAALNDLHSVVRTLTDAVMHRSVRAEIERIAVERIASTESYALAWVDVRSDDGVFETTAVGAADSDAPIPVVVGGRATDWPDDDLALRAHLTDELVLQDVRDVQDATGRESALADRGFERWAAVPMAFEDECFGILNVATYRRDGLADRETAVLGQLGEILGLAIATVERERTLAYERERMEFVNRFIRHNLLNSLNVVSARSEILDSYVDDDGREHLRTVQERTADMIELIETLRGLMQAFSSDESQEMVPVDLNEVVLAEVEDAREGFDASFEASVPEESVMVMADDLLGEVFENLLANAVQHNDATAPRVSVSVSTTAETATVRVVDNGSGISESMLSKLFEKGEHGFQSPGTGFGLYLVREVVDAYGGDVTVENESGGGATFSVTLPRTTDS